MGTTAHRSRVEGVEQAPYRGSADPLLGGGGSLPLEEVFHQDEQGDTHQSQRHAALRIVRPLEHARCLQVLRPAQAHGKLKTNPYELLRKS